MFSLPSELITHIYQFDPTYYDIYQEVLLDLLLYHYYKYKLKIYKNKINVLYEYDYSIKIENNIFKLNKKITELELKMYINEKKITESDLYCLYGKWLIELDLLLNRVTTQINM